MTLIQKQKYTSMGQDREPRDISMHLWSPTFDQETRILNGQKTASSINGVSGKLDSYV